MHAVNSGGMHSLRFDEPAIVRGLQDLPKVGAIPL